MVDVDSEKWMQYGRARWPGLAYKIEGHRLRRREASFAKQAACTFVVTPQERDLLQEIAPGAKTACAPNGVDFNYYDPFLQYEATSLATRKFVAFVGSMDYYPNVEGCDWFAKSVLPALRGRVPDLEFFIIGRNPAKAVRRLANLPGVVVTGGVPDVRPYLAFARSVVAPLKIARGIQNKVLEALAMGKSVLASPAVAKTFGVTLPHGVIVCNSEADYTREIAAVAEDLISPDQKIRKDVQARFSWSQSLERISAELESQQEGLIVRG
jgi:sugar transferase (PEP-CTERM/EpsH1 system associated)